MMFQIYKLFIFNRSLIFNPQINDMLTKFRILIVLMFSASILMAQENKTNLDIKKDKFEGIFEDEIEIGESGVMTLRFFNAENGNPIPEANIIIRDIGEFTTDLEGKVRFPKLEKDQKLQIMFSCEDYITSVFSSEVVAGTIFYNRFSVSPILDIGTIRIVLDWDEKPADLDAHFLKENNYHISFRNTRILQDGKGLLDLDDMDGFGPETITVMDISETDTYTYFVHDYTNRENYRSSNLSNSKANVKVFADNRLMKVIEIPRMGIGTKWMVFKIENGAFVILNNVE